MTTAAAPMSPLAAVAAAMPEVAARDAVIAWYRGEFAAANAIIDALCAHIVEIGGGAGGDYYDNAFAALHRRRLNWFPVLHMQKFFSVADVCAELRRAAAARSDPPPPPPEMEPEVPPAKAEATPAKEEAAEEDQPFIPPPPPPAAAEEEDDGGVNGAVEERVADGEDSTGDSSDQKPVSSDGDGVNDGRSQEDQSVFEGLQICSDHEDCAARAEKIKIMKGFVAKEPVKGHMVNVVKGLKIYQDIFTPAELLKLNDFIDDLRQAGHRGELSGETFIFFNKQMKGNKREIIQLGVPLFHQANEEATSNNEPIPELLQAVIDHLVLWRLIPETRKPNSVIINFFDEDEHSQPYFKPPHLDNPISTLLLSDTSMAFGKVLVANQNGNFGGSLALDLKQGSLLVMRGNSADIARHVVCPSASKRVTVTFVKVRPSQPEAALSSPTKAVALWQPPPSPLPQKLAPSTTLIPYTPHAVLAPAWGMAVRAPFVAVTAAPPARPLLLASGKRATRGGTGVFLPWTVGPKRYNKHLPPRIQKRRFSTSLTPSIEAPA